MFRIITISEMQKKIGKIIKDVKNTNYLITSRGKAKAVIVPYFEGCEEMIEDFIEDCEMYQNKDALEKEARESLASGESDLVI